MTKKLPNILVTGVPGSGKTTFCETFEAGNSNRSQTFRHINVSQLVKEKNLYERYDEKYDTLILDEDKASFIY
jgi:adenylate kinase